MYDIIARIIDYGGTTGNYQSSYFNICGAIIILIILFAMNFILEFLSSMFHK